MKVCFFVFTLLYIVSIPSTANAGFFTDFVGNIFGTGVEASEITTIDPTEDTTKNSQTIALLEPSLTPDLKNISETSIVTIVGDEAIESTVGPLGTEADISNYAYSSSSSSKINVYLVKPGDTLDSIAKVNNVTKQAIIYANSDISSADLTKAGTSLVIIPLNGALYTVKSTDTVDSISKKYKISTRDILEYNVLSKESDLKTGSIIVLVGVDKSALVAKPVVVKPVTPAKSTIPETPKVTPPSSGAKSTNTPVGKYIWPFPAGAGSISQRLHADRAVDLRAPKGTPIYAIADGNVIIAHHTGYNGGFGLYVVEDFDNGAQAIYGHMSLVVANAGDRVKQGDLIGYVGSTGHSTGPHLHLGIHGGAENPFEGLKVGNTSYDFNR